MDLGDILSDKEEVSTENNHGQVVDIQYDKTKADITQQPPEIDSLSSRLPYVRRAIRYAEKAGWSVVDDTFRRVLIARTEGKLVLSIREADIAYRKQIDLKSTMLALAFSKFGVMLTEDDSELSAGVFQLRHRYNKGITWRKEKKSMCSPQDQLSGEQKLQQIEFELNSLGLPLHEEEKENGFDKEFMKLEWMNWGQFTSVMSKARKEPQQTRELLI